MLFIKSLFMTNNQPPSIVLTGTIIPNIREYHRHLDASVRRAEYLQSIRFYSQIAPVYFLENSVYPLLTDEEFQSLPNTQICQFPLSEFSEKGRGFQEFEMLDRWIASTPNLPEHWLKVTGRYKYENIQQIWLECQRPQTPELIINQHRFAGYANPAIFYVSIAYYRTHLTGLYQGCDDPSGKFIEKVLYKNLRHQPLDRCQRFRSPLICAGIAGSSGQEIRNPGRDRLNAIAATINYLFDKQYIWLSF
jgi:hypothetical protein